MSGFISLELRKYVAAAGRSSMSAQQRGRRSGDLLSPGGQGLAKSFSGCGAGRARADKYNTRQVPNND
eukprot:scaffold10541_cov99-Skeletonema_dohrnii-CCMP3373.AAC.1